MNTKKLCFAPAPLFALAFSTGVFSATALAYEAPQNPRAKLNFNSGWKLNAGDAPGAEAPTFDDAKWKNVTMPYAWNGDEAFKNDIRRLSNGVAWYRKKFVLPAGSVGKKVFLEFEGIRHAGEFTLNGQPIGSSENGIMAFGFDVSNVVKPAPQENVLAAKIDSSWRYQEKATGTGYQWNHTSFYANYGGINKNVNLHLTDRLYQTLPLFSNLGTTGVYVHAANYDIRGKSAVVTAQSQVKNEYPTAKTFAYQVVIEDMSGKAIKTFRGAPKTLAAGAMGDVSASAKVENLNFWSWGYGYLYNVYTSLVVDGRPVDVVKTRTGFRKTGFGNGMIKLNDRTIQVHGYAQRTTNEWPAQGISIPPWMSDFSNRMMVEGGANLVRWMHVTPSKQDVESCDRVGLLQALPAGDSERDVDGRQWDQRLEVMRDATIYHRNNPSVLFYETGNKGVRESHMTQMKAIRDQYDPFGGRAAGSREMLDSKVAEFGGEMLYINKSARIPFWAMEYSRDEGARIFWDELTPPFHKDGAGPLHNGQNASAYNRNQDSHAIENVERWYDYWRERPGTGKRVSSGGVNIVFSDSNTHHRGDNNYRRSGEVDAMRIPKDGFFAHQVMWDGWVDVEKPRAYIIGHWNYAPGTKKTVSVVSSAEKVELFVGGVSKGFAQGSHRFLFTFPSIEWQPGAIRAVGYDAAGKKLCETEKQTAGAPAAIRLTPRTGPGGLKADDSDLALVDVEVVDAQGRRCPTALNLINFTLGGPAQWRGGIAQGPDNYILSSSLPVEGGINRVMVRALSQPGAIALSASAPGLKSAMISLVSKAVPTAKGVAVLFPDAHLPSFLGRGPTPLTDSVTPTRLPVQIVSASAGANGTNAAQSYDDNEITGWSNDDKRATGWINYELAQAAPVSEITMKLGGWRTKSYPIRVSVGDKVVFSGVAPQSLGYVTIPFAPTVGKNLKIELIGSAAQQDAFGAITELENQANAATTGGQGDAKGTLQIIEMEIYQPIRRGNNALK